MDGLLLKMKEEKKMSGSNGKKFGEYDNKLDYMTKTPVKKLILKLSVPTIISMLVTTLYNAADTYFVGKISTQATAAVGVVFAVMAIIQAVGFFCGHGSGNYIARSLGAKKDKEANEMAATGFTIAIILGLIITVSGFIFSEPIAIALGATENILEETKTYMRIILIGAPIMTAQFVVNNQLRFQGSATYAMVGLLSGGIINVGLDPLFIFGFGLGVRGAAIATVMSQTVSFIVLLMGTKVGGNLKIRSSNIRLNFYYLKEITNGGAPSLFRQGLAAAATIIMNNMAKKYGMLESPEMADAALAAMSIVTRTAMFANSALIGFGQGYQPVCSFSYGAKKYSRVREGYFFCVKIATIFLAVVSVLAVIFAPNIVRVFRNDDLVIKIGAEALRYQASVFVLGGVIIMSNMMMQSIGKGVRATIMSSARSGLFFIPLIIILTNKFGLRGVEMTQMFADICAFLLSIPLVTSVFREFNEEEKSKGNPAEQKA